MSRTLWHATTKAAALLLVLVLGSIHSLASAQVTSTRSTKPDASSYVRPSTCASRSINYITQTLPKQCLTTSWASKPSTQNTTIHDATSASSSASNASVPEDSMLSAFSDVIVTSTEIHVQGRSSAVASTTTHHPEVQSVLSTAGPVRTAELSIETAQESDVDSPLDNANFLSFEEWKRKNLAKAGQSAENLGAKAGRGKEQRRRPGNINNALDSLGEDAEIDIEFGGFVNPGPMKDALPVQGAKVKGTGQPGPDHRQDEEAAEGTTGTRRRSKDAGKTCKERTNYASYDCAATPLKTNPECKSSSAVLVENKDSYMLNICSAQNKFFIVELCDAILIDTVVLANFEFFSSMFRNFRVSVSDRYPVKLDKWRELGTYEARNSREVQAFLVENPLIWARYLRVEFLTHYGNEYYCPVSLLRVHGTTMMEEFNTEVKNAGMGEDLEGEEVESEVGQEGNGLPAVISAEVITTSPETNLEQLSGVSTAVDVTTTLASGDPPSSTSVPLKELNASYTSPFVHSRFQIRNGSIRAWLGAQFSTADETHPVCLAENQPFTTNLTPSNTTSGVKKIITTGPRASEVSSLVTTSGAGSSLNETIPSISSSMSRNTSLATSQTVGSSDAVGSQNGTEPHSSSTTFTSVSTSKIQTSSTQPPASNPTTQESFFKSVHKRLQLLEANSTLSLQYIEEQSRILRDAFSKVEKRQLAKTSTFLETLNSTVLTELHEFRMQYDQIWQSTVLELSSQREQSQHEVFALSARLGLLADEIVFQKRMAILQFLLILLCLGLVIFFKHGSATTYLELPPLVQNAINKSSTNISRYTPHFETPPTSPPASRPPSRYGNFRGIPHRRNPSEESYAPPGDKSPSIEYSPPTPKSQRLAARDIDSSPARSHNEDMSDDPPEAYEGIRPRIAPGMRDTKISDQGELVEEALLPSDSSVERELNGGVRYSHGK
ncbi:MAG: hypothetical protein Q9217_002643 [Psora testacea]